MASRSRAQRARAAFGAAGDNPYLRRLIEDERLRDSIKEAYVAARDALERVSSNGKGPIDTVIDDKKVHKDIRRAAESLREASERLRGEKRKRRWGRVILFALAGAALALVLSEDLRKAVLDKLFGAEEEFEYSPNAAAPAAAPEPAAAE